MKKSLLALAVLGAFAGAASAQSSVTIYGSIDQAVSRGNGGTATNQGANGTSKAWLVRQSNTSRLGFRGNEDLGGGLSAQFQIEHRFNPDDGAQNAAVFWQGRSYVQLSSATMGRVYLGREYTPAFWPAVKSDPFGWDGVAQGGMTMFAGYASTSGSRVNNTVGYKTPNFGGFTVNAAVGLGEGVTSRANGFNAEYGAGPIYAALGFEKLTGGPAATDGNSLVNLAFHYDLGMVKPMAYVARAKVAAGTLSNKYWQIGALAPVGPGNVKAFYGRLDPAGANNVQNKLGLGYDYALSKRTNLYGDVSFAKEDQRTNNRAFALGVKHTF
jgi:predicted porin